MRTARQYTIEAPELLTGRERTRDVVFTGLMWFIYAYLWLPAISLGAWLLGLNFAYEVLVRAGGTAALQRVLLGYGIALAIIIALVMLWSAVERRRFADQHRRQPQAQVADQAMLQFFGVDAQSLVGLRSGRCVELAFDEQGQVSAVAVTIPGPSDARTDGATSGVGRPPTRNLPRTG